MLYVCYAVCVYYMYAICMLHVICYMYIICQFSASKDGGGTYINMRSLLGWLETRLARITLTYLNRYWYVSRYVKLC